MHPSTYTPGPSLLKVAEHVIRRHERTDGTRITITDPSGKEIRVTNFSITLSLTDPLRITGWADGHTVYSWKSY